MSESTSLFPARRGRDRGMTLPELLICISLMGLLVTVLSSAIVVTLRQQSSTEGRLNVARSEQGVSLWMPSDLASASDVDTNPSITPCDSSILNPPAVCDGIDLSYGSNVMMMSWDVDTDHHGNGIRTNVSYHYTPSGDGESYELWRVECIRPYTKTDDVPVLHGSWTCHKLVALRDLAGPPTDAFGDPMEFKAGQTSPTWVIRVSEPLAPDDEGEGRVDDREFWKDANRVIVTIDGGGATEGAGGGRNQISITAGGTTRQDLPTTSMVGSPSFVAARSRCGGPITLVIDESASIGNENILIVRDAVREFIDAVRGTPVRVQIVTFASQTRVLGATASEWHKYYDMWDPAQADAIYAAANQIQMHASNSTMGQYTNWEDALYRLGYEKNGTITVDDMPHTVVFFTDGVPTADWTRTNPASRTAGTTTAVGWPTPGQPDYERVTLSGWGNHGTAFHQVSYNRPEWIARQIRGKTKLIGVGVGVFEVGSLKGNGQKATQADVQSSWRFAKGDTPAPRLNKDILADLIIGDVIVKNGTGNSVIEAVPGVVNGSPGYINPDTARLYLPKTWDMLPAALRTVALGECAGTVTFQTRNAATGEHVDEPFRYLADRAVDANGNDSPEVKKFAETNIATRVRTFDLSIPSGEYVDVDFLPIDFSAVADLGYSTDRWECTIGGVKVQNLPQLPGGRDGWFGFSLQVPANGAVACTHFVKHTAPPAG